MRLPFGSLVFFAYLSPLEKVLTFEKTKINFVFCSFNRTFAPRYEKIVYINRYFMGRLRFTGPGT